jgi:hypothetical protein
MTTSLALRAPRASSPALVLGLLAGGLVVAGVLLPWVSTFAGLVSLTGTVSPGGRLLLLLGVLTALAALLPVVRRDLPGRLATGVLGFTTLVYAGYLLLNLLAAVRAADSMALAAVGPGLPLVLLGGALGLGTLFVPSAPTPVPVAELRREDGADRHRRGGAEHGGPVDHGGRRLRTTGALLAVVAAGAHVPVTPEHLRQAPYIGVGFMLLTAALLLLASALHVTGSPLVWWALAAVCGAAVLAYVVSRTVGLPLVADDVGNWWEPLGVLSVLTETGAAATAVRALTRHPRVAAGR